MIGRAGTDSPERVAAPPARPYFRANRRYPGIPVTASYLPPLAPYTTTRLRRNRRDPWSRKIVAENILTAGVLILPVFLHDELGRGTMLSVSDYHQLSIVAVVDSGVETTATD